MASIRAALTSVSAYPIPSRTIEEIAARRGIALSDEVTQATLKGKAYNLSVADLLMWLAVAPNISQGGQSYTFSDEQRSQFRYRANSIYLNFGSDEIGTPKPVYGYKGSRL